MKIHEISAKMSVFKLANYRKKNRSNRSYEQRMVTVLVSDCPEHGFDKFIPIPNSLEPLHAINF
jgi:hypothetical protein